MTEAMVVKWKPTARTTISMTRRTTASVLSRRTSDEEVGDTISSTRRTTRTRRPRRTKQRKTYMLYASKASRLDTTLCAEAAAKRPSRKSEALCTMECPSYRERYCNTWDHVPTTVRAQPMSASTASAVNL